MVFLKLFSIFAKIERKMFKDFTKYEIYEDGRIWSYSRKKFLKPRTNKDGYQQVALSDNEGKTKNYLVHRVVWEAVTGEPIPEGYEINHITEDKTENSFCSLNLMSHKENCNFGTRNERRAKAQTNGVLSKQVGAFKDDELVMTFQSTREAQRQGFNQGAISDCCNGKRKTHKGFVWRYI